MKTIIFDLDGTLISSHEDVWLCLEKALQPYHKSIPKQIREDNRILLQSAGDILKMVCPDASPADCEQYSRDVRYFYSTESKFENTYLYPGVSGLIEQLYQNGNRLLIVTMKSERSARAVLKAKGIDRFFEGVYAPDSFPPDQRRKAEIFQRLKEQYGLRADTCLTVGDQPTDVEAARTAGLPTAAAAWGYGELEALQNSQPAGLVTSVEELLRFLTTWQFGFHYLK